MCPGPSWASPAASPSSENTLTVTAPETDQTLSSPRVAILTVAHRQHAEVLHQIGAIALNTRPPDLHVLVAMADKALGLGKLPVTSDRWETTICTARTDLRKPLPIGAARNMAAATAIEAGCDVLVFLDPLLIPGPRFLAVAVDRACSGRHRSPVLWSGELRRLPPPDGPGQPIQSLEVLAAGVPNPQLLPLDYESVLTDPTSVVGGALVITAEGFRSTRGFSVDDAGTGDLDSAFAHDILTSGGTLVRFGGAPTYVQHPAPGQGQADAPGVDG